MPLTELDVFDRFFLDGVGQLYSTFWLYIVHLDLLVLAKLDLPYSLVEVHGLLFSDLGV